MMLLDTTPEKVVAFSTANISVYTDMFAVEWELMLLNTAPKKVVALSTANMSVYVDIFAGSGGW